MDNTGRYAGLVPDFKPREVPETTSGSKSALIYGLAGYLVEKGEGCSSEFVEGTNKDRAEHRRRELVEWGFKEAKVTPLYRIVAS